MSSSGESERGKERFGYALVQSNHTRYPTVKRTVSCTLKDMVQMPRIVTAEDLRSHLGRELDSLRSAEEALYVTKRGRLTAVLLDVDRYNELVERIEYMEDSLAALQARDESDTAVPWSEVRQ